MVRTTVFLPLLLLAACSSESSSPAVAAEPFVSEPVATFEEPWAMAFLPDGTHMLITEKKGRLILFDRADRSSVVVSGTPAVAYGGQGGFGDVVLHPEFGDNGLVYLSWAEAGNGARRGAAVGRGKLVVAGGSARIEGFQVIWRQEPKVEGKGHYSHRIAFSPDGQYMFLSSGDRQKFTPAQEMDQNLGKILRLTPTGMIPSSNPHYDQGRIRAQLWSLGHRNALGLAFDGAGRLWDVEMGPRGGDELNLVVEGRNYGWPVVSNGDHYDGRDIPDHATRPDFEAPKLSWNPVISPSSLIFYSGDLFPQWKGSAFIGGLSSEALVRVTFDGTSAREAERFAMGARIREVEQGPDGALWLLEDGDSGGRLLRLSPAGK